jgi:hypothetical protein
MDKKTLAFSSIWLVIASVGLVRTARAAPEECKNVEKGDVAACKQRVAKECTQEKYWDKRKCEDAIVAQVDQCFARAADLDKACDAAREIESKICGASLNLDEGRDRDSNLEAWIGAANRVAADEQRYAKIVGEWGMCTRGSDRGEGCSLQASACDGATAKLKGQLATAVDALLAKKLSDEAREHLASYKRSQDSLALANARHFAEMMKKNAQVFLDITAKIPKALRVKEKELRELVAVADEILADNAKAEDAAIATRRCPAGKKADAKWAKMIKAHIGAKHAKAIQIMRQGDKQKSRDGLVSTESVPITFCDKGYVAKDVCAAWKMSVYRERPPGGAWTSWRVAVGGDYRINCKKLK